VRSVGVGRGEDDVRATRVSAARAIHHDRLKPMEVGFVCFTTILLSWRER